MCIINGLYSDVLIQQTLHEPPACEHTHNDMRHLTQGPCHPHTDICLHRTRHSFRGFLYLDVVREGDFPTMAGVVRRIHLITQV